MFALKLASRSPVESVKRLALLLRGVYDELGSYMRGVLAFVHFACLHFAFLHFARKRPPELRFGQLLDETASFFEPDANPATGAPQLAAVAIASIAIAIA